MGTSLTRHTAKTATELTTIVSQTPVIVSEFAALKPPRSFASNSLQDDATEAEWYDVTQLPALAFDHKLIIRTAFEHLLQHSETKSAGELGLVWAPRCICWVFCLS